MYDHRIGFISEKMAQRTWPSGSMKLGFEALPTKWKKEKYYD
jgi:hypothetical protein